MTRQGKIIRAGALGAALGLSGCMGGGDLVSKSPFSFMGGAEAPAPDANTPILDPTLENGASSPVIEALLNRRSVLDGGAFAQVADGVLAANSRAAEADLRAAKLRAEARATNWLPTLGPNVSLTSLSDVVTSLVVDAVLFDNGRKKAERDYAAADVEVAAVTLAEDTNGRVRQALELYIRAEAARARAQVNADGMAQMERYAYVMAERVKGGVSSPVERQIVDQKLAAMRSQMVADQEAARTALAELSAMSVRPVDGISGLGGMRQELTAEPLAVLKAQAEASRSGAEARAARAGLLPSLTASASVGSGGSDGGVNLGGAGFGFGTGASLAALEEQQAATEARVGQVREDANRRLAALQSELAAQQRQAAEAQTLAAQAEANFQIYAAQQREGQRSVPEVIGLFETALRTAREAIDLRHDIARTEVQIAALKGTLVDGDAI